MLKSFSKFKVWDIAKIPITCFHTFLQKCVVCDQVALCVNFGILLCEPCKSFVRRNAKKLAVLKFDAI